jgi:hypothetical protein
VHGNKGGKEGTHPNSPVGPEPLRCHSCKAKKPETATTAIVSTLTARMRYEQTHEATSMRSNVGGFVPPVRMAVPM